MTQAVMSEIDPKPKQPKRKANGQRVNPSNWALAEKLYVEGELQGENEHTVRLYLSRGVIAKRADCSEAALDQRARRYGWGEKRRAFAAETGVVLGRVPDVTLAKDGSGQVVTAGKRSRRDAEAILTAYIDLYADAVAKKRVRYDSIGDLEKAVRLLAFVRGQAESIKQTHTTVSLEIMQARHKAARAYVGGTVDDSVAGVLGRGTPAAVDAEFTEEAEAVPEDESGSTPAELVDDDAWAR